MSRRYLGSWVLPSGNSCNAYLDEDACRTSGSLTFGGLSIEWDDPPSPSWPDKDRVHYEVIVFPKILEAVAAVTGQRVLGVQL